MPYIVDVLLDFPPRREFNTSELAELAGVSPQSVSRHLDLLLQTEIVEPVEERARSATGFNEASAVSEALIQLDGAMNAVGESGESGRRVS